MKKRLLWVPVFASLVLTGCEFTIFGKTIRIGEPDTLELPENFKQEIDGYKMATKLKDGGEYILGVYRINEDIMRFADGNYHSDKNGQYSFYLGTSTDISEAATVVATSLGNGEFSLQMITSKGRPWNNKYIGVYSAESSYSNKVMSIAPLDELDQTTFTVTNKKSTSQVTAKTQTHFKYYETLDGMPAYTVGAMYLHEGVDEEEVVKFIGTGHNQSDTEPEYTSMDCKSYEVALSLDAYDLAHLYEKK